MLMSTLLGQGFASVFTAVSPEPTTVACAQFVEQAEITGPSPGARRNPRAAAGGAEV